MVTVHWQGIVRLTCLLPARLPRPSAQAGAREYCGNSFPDGMRKNDRLAQVRWPEQGSHHNCAMNAFSMRLQHCSLLLLLLRLTPHSPCALPRTSSRPPPRPRTMTCPSAQQRLWPRA